MYAGKRYFECKEKWFKERCKDIVEDIQEKDISELSKLITLTADNAGRPLSNGFNTEDDDENASIARLSQQGYLDVKYADNVP